MSIALSFDLEALGFDQFVLVEVHHLLLCGDQVPFEGNFGCL